MSDITQRIQQIRERISRAAEHAGRDPAAIQLMAVSKTHPPESIVEAYAAGIRVFGESRVQEFAGKVTSLQSLKDAQWMLIGHLQSNKAGKAAELFQGIHSVDSLSLLKRLNAARGKLNAVRLPVLIEINTGGEAAKTGLPPELEEITDLLNMATEWPHIQIRGLMTIPPHTDNPEGARPYFRRLRRLQDEIRKNNFPTVSMDELSMGMSHDFEVAIEEGSTCVRIGTAIFGERKSK